MGIIAFDARSVRPYQTGLGRVAENLLRSLAKIDHENEYLVIQRADMKEPIVSGPRFIVDKDSGWFGWFRNCAGHRRQIFWIT